MLRSACVWKPNGARPAADIRASCRPNSGPCSGLSPISTGWDLSVAASTSVINSSLSLTAHRSTTIRSVFMSKRPTPNTTGLSPSSTGSSWRTCPEQYTLIDREEDLGIPGLRQAKLSYHPAFLEKKYTALCLYPDEIACKRLWIKCFGDEETFIDSFLIGHYSRKRMLAAEEDGRLAAMLHLIPFESELGRDLHLRRGDRPRLPGPGPGLRIDARGDAADRRRRGRRRDLIPSQESLKDFFTPRSASKTGRFRSFSKRRTTSTSARAIRNRIGLWSGAATTAHRCPNVCTAGFSDPAKNRSAESTAGRLEASRPYFLRSSEHPLPRDRIRRFHSFGEEVTDYRQKTSKSLQIIRQMFNFVRLKTDIVNFK